MAPANTLGGNGKGMLPSMERLWVGAGSHVLCTWHLVGVTTVDGLADRWPSAEMWF